MNEECKKKRIPHPRDNANILSTFTFYYTLDLFKKGYKSDLEHDDLYQVIKSCNSKKLGNNLEKEWELEKKNNKVPSLIRALWRCFGKAYIVLGIVQFLMRTVMVLFVPQALGKLVSYFSPEQKQLTKGDAYMYASIVIVFNLINAIYMHNYQLAIAELGIRIRTAVCSLIYRKCLKLSSESLSEISIGNIISLITKDARSFELVILFGNDVWIGLVQTIIIAGLIYAKIGVAAFAGVGFFLVVLPIQILIGIMAMKLRLKTNKKMDERLQLTQETLSTIKIIKMYVWENFFKGKIFAARKKEIKIIHVLIYMKILILIIGGLATKVAFFLLIITHAALGNYITAEIVFFIHTCFEKLRHLVAVLIPLGLTFIAEFFATNIRLNRLLNYEEIPKTSLVIEKTIKDPSINFKDVTITLGKQQIFKNITFKLSKGLNVVSGYLGSGKTTLIKSILKEYRTEGILEVCGTISYASQEPWLFPSTIRNNILFGEHFNEKRYNKVLDICALTYDLNLLDYGDNTVIGDRGLNLSRGQQARINLARAIYKNADIYLLDDCLSALDGLVADSVFHNCIQEFLKDKLCVFVTNNQEHIKAANFTVVVNNGSVEVGTNLQMIPIKLEKTQQEDDHVILPKMNDKTLYFETKKSGKVDWEIYKNYLNMGGGFWILCLVLITFVAARTSSTSAEKMISSWVTLEQNLSDLAMKNLTNSFEYHQTMDERTKYLYYIAIVMLATSILLLIQYFSFYRVIRKISIRLHKLMLDTVINTKMKFFDMNFIGNVLNRFSKDLCMIDEHLPFTIDFCLELVFHMFGIVFLISTVNPLFLIPSGILFLIAYIIRIIYQRTGRSLQRMDASTRSPWIGHLNASLEGLTTIRAFKGEAMAIDEFDKHQDLFTSANYSVQCSIRALGFVLDVLCSLFVALVIARFLMLPIDTSVGNVGLAITQAFGLTGLLQYGIMKLAEFENGMTSVERALEYCKLDREDTKGKVLTNWPKDGDIHFQHVSMSYSKDTKSVLNNIDLKIGARQRIGVVGRTGAGKSSIISTLFRLYDIEGTVNIDGENINEISLPLLRSSLAIIPQEPVMFSGTIRENLDPFKLYPDDEIWRIIKITKLEKIITNLCASVDNSLSAGQKQLLCLARAMLRNNKIIILDEATANLDQETDAVIREVIDKYFTNCTLIIIAHRLASVFTSDIIIVMNEGQIVEMDKPKNLIENQDSLFYNMIKRT